MAKCKHCDFRGSINAVVEHIMKVHAKMIVLDYEVKQKE